MAETGWQNILPRNAEQLYLSTPHQASDETCTLSAFIPDSLQLGPSVHGNIFHFPKKREIRRIKNILN